MTDAISTAFSDSWIWLSFVVIGLLFVLVELVIGVDTGLDLVIVGSTFIIGGLVTAALSSWVLTLIVTSVICVAYVVLGRRYVHRWRVVRKTQTNVDTIVGRAGIVLQDIARHGNGLVKVGFEEWRASADEDIKSGEGIVVTAVQGVTLIVRKTEGGE